MSAENKIEINAAIFPTIMKLAIGKPIPKDSETLDDDMSAGFQDMNLMVELPKSVYLMYLQKMVSEHSEIETRLLKQYAYGVAFSDEDYEELLKLIMTPVNRNWTQTVQGDILTPFGIQLCTNDDGEQKFELIETEVPVIKVETWECIIIAHLKKAAFEIIECFDFNSSFTRKHANSSDTSELKISLGAWKFSGDKTEQSLSNALRSAFMFTLVGYHCGDNKDQYQSFSDYFDAEFYKRVSLVHGMWTSRGDKETIEYVPLYESFHNLDGMRKEDLIQMLKAILDNEAIALDDKETLKNRLIEGAGTFHHDIDSTDVALEQSLIKPAMNYILLREKAKESIEAAELLCAQGLYPSCANRCYYAMMDSLKVLLENKGLLPSWNENELKGTESHRILENQFNEFVTQGVLNSVDKAAFEYVKEQRWKCDYSLYVFKKEDAENCVRKVKDFYSKIETIAV